MMNVSSLVFLNQFARFKREKGMFIFYCLSIALIGIALPCFFHGVESFLTMAALFTVLYVRPLLADSLAGEREHRTLETLLSSPVSGKSIVWGKCRFCLYFALVFFGAAVILGAMMFQFTGYAIAFEAWQWLGVAAGALLIFGAISIAGVFASATSVDLRTANSRIARSAYPLGLLYLVFLTVLVAAGFLPSLVVGSAVALVCLGIIAYYAFRIRTMKQSDYYENVKAKSVAKKRNQLVPNERFLTGTAPKSPFETVFRFELKYFRKLKTLLVNFGLLCASPALVTWAIAYLIGVKQGIHNERARRKGVPA